MKSVKLFFATEKGKLPIENEMVAGLVTGHRSDQTWHSKRTAIDFFDLKGAVEGLFHALKVENPVFERINAEAYPFLKTGESAQVSSGNRHIGVLGKIEGRVLKNFGLKQDAFVFEFDLSAMESLLPDAVSASSLPRFPAISRDITIIVDSSVALGQIRERLDRIVQAEPLLESVHLFDVFEGAPVPDGKKSMSFRVVYRSENKTLKDKNVKKLHAMISQTLLDEFSADLPE